VDLDPLFITPITITIVQLWRILVCESGEFVQATAGQFSQVAQMGVEMREQRRFPVEGEQSTQAGINLVEVEIPAIWPEMPGATRYGSAAGKSGRASDMGRERSKIVHGRNGGEAATPSQTIITPGMLS
jgi:hypothetical protein